MSVALLSTTYFGPVQWYQKLYRHDEVLIEGCESFTKQTYRNRCLIATAQGVQALTIPVVSKHNAQCVMRNEQCTMHNVQGTTASIQSIRISDHGNWRHQHWQAITSAYGDSPFLEYYEDDLRPFFFDNRWELLFDFNEAIRRTMCNLLDIHPRVSFTKEYLSSVEGTSELCDYRQSIRPKQSPHDPDFSSNPYYQVFSSRHGFLPNMSILDLLLNMGPEAVLYL